MCRLAGVSRASYYRHWESVAPDEAEWRRESHSGRWCWRTTDGMVTGAWPRIASPGGMMINHKRVLRIMREDNLLAIRYRKYILTTDSSTTTRYM